MTLLTGLLRVSLIVSEVMNKGTIVVKSHEPSTILSVLTNTHMRGGGRKVRLTFLEVPILWIIELESF